ncbi:hypothetical protein GE061_006055 [Apolygus lucorum]|nr:hypothetical protein GE061_006055 [Apolygus lucorum]
MKPRWGEDEKRQIIPKPVKPTIFAWYPERPEDQRLIQEHSWTRAKPVKDGFEYHKPLETIGTGYTPTSKHLRLEYLPPQKKKLKPTQVMNEHGEFQYPPESNDAEEDMNFEKSRAVRKAAAAERNKPGIVSLTELLSGEYTRRKKEEARAKRVKRRHELKEKALKEAREEEQKKR